MALFTKHEIRLVVATDGTNYKTKAFERDDQSTHQVERTDHAMSIQGVAVLASGEGHTIKLDETNLGKVTGIYVAASADCTIDLLDATGTVNEIVGLKLGGASGTGPAQFFAEINGFTVAASDTFVITNGTTTNTVEYVLLGSAD